MFIVCSLLRGCFRWSSNNRIVWLISAISLLLWLVKWIINWINRSSGGIEWESLGSCWMWKLTGCPGAGLINLERGMAQFQKLIRSPYPSCVLMMGDRWTEIDWQLKGISFEVELEDFAIMIEWPNSINSVCVSVHLLLLRWRETSPSHPPNALI